MVQKHNRQMSFSLYISVLAISDTIILVNGKFYRMLLRVTGFTCGTSAAKIYSKVMKEEKLDECNKHSLPSNSTCFKNR